MKKSRSNHEEVFWKNRVSPCTPVLNGHDQAGWNTKQNKMKNTLYTILQVLKVLLIKI